MTEVNIGTGAKGKGVTEFRFRYDDDGLGDYVDIEVREDPADPWVGVAIERESFLAGVSELFNVDITPRPKPIKPLEVGDVVEDVSVLTNIAENRRAVFIDSDGDVWAWDNENKVWTVALRGYTQITINDPTLVPLKVIAIRETIDPLPH